MQKLRHIIALFVVGFMALPTANDSMLIKCVEGVECEEVAMNESPELEEVKRIAKADNLINTALKYLGVKYRWGESSPEGFDCSGFTKYVFKEEGIDLARTSYSQCREGEKIENIKTILGKIEKNSENDINGYAKKLEDRIVKFLDDHSVQVDEQRILTEVAIFADKVAIDEELVRLKSHFDAFYDIVSSNEPAGRKLDFLLQEMNRETNTIGSKASNTETAHLVVSIKTELEKIREQIQNIE